MAALLSKINTLTFIIDGSLAPGKGERADKVLSQLKGLPSRSQTKVWFKEGRIRRGLEMLEPKTLLREGDRVEILPPEPRQLELEPRKLELKIFFEDDELIVLYKPKGLTMHPGAGTRDKTTLVHGLLAHSKNLSDTGGEFRPGIVHRLDKETEGIVVVAKNNEVHQKLSEQFSSRKIDRAYWALCWGKFPAHKIIEAPIGRNPRDRTSNPFNKAKRAIIAKAPTCEAPSHFPTTYPGRTIRDTVGAKSDTYRPSEASPKSGVASRATGSEKKNE
jgi:23S rRNA pseudouridine1911/1915/1917 synthase